MATWNDQNKSASSFTNVPRGGSYITWNQDTLTWDQDTATWNDPLDVFTNQTKHSSAFTNGTKH